MLDHRLLDPLSMVVDRRAAEASLMCSTRDGTPAATPDGSRIANPEINRYTPPRREPP